MLKTKIYSYVIILNDQLTGMSEGYLYETDNLNTVRFWSNREEAEKYLSICSKSPTYQNMRIEPVVLSSY